MGERTWRRGKGVNNCVYGRRTVTGTVCLFLWLKLTQKEVQKMKKLLLILASVLLLVGVGSASAAGFPYGFDGYLATSFPFLGYNPGEFTILPMGVSLV